MSNFTGLDLETYGDLQEYALQAYRATRGQAGIRAISVANSTQALGILNPDTTKLTNILKSLKGKYVVCWNTTFDVSWLYAVGIEFRELQWGPAPGDFVRLDEGFHSIEERRRAIKTGACQRLSKNQREATPLPFRDLLVSLAESAGAWNEVFAA